MLRTTRLRAVAVLGATALVLTGCGGDEDPGGEGDPTATDTAMDDSTATETAMDDSTATETAMDDSTATATATAAGSGDGTLTIGTILPATGDLSFLGPPEFAAAQLAVNRMNEAGGVLGNDVEYLEGDSGDTTTNIASQTVDEHLADGADAIVGAASSAVSFTVIDKITGAGVIHFSPANTSPDFTDYDDNGLYFRTAPSDVLQGKVLSDLVLENGGQSVVVMARQEPYGDGLRRFTSQPLEEAGVNVTEIPYDPNATEFAAEVQEAAAANPDNIVLIGFDESEQIIREMISAGIGPQEGPTLWLVDGNVGNSLGELMGNEGNLEGVKGTLPSAETSDEFRDALLEVNPDLQDFSYAPETYDALIIIGLATEVAGTDDPEAIAAEINGVTRDGEKCGSFEECLPLIEDGTDIDYDGQGGPYEFSEAGEPTAASFAILQYDETDTIDPSLTEYRTAEIEE